MLWFNSTSSGKINFLAFLRELLVNARELQDLGLGRDCIWMFVDLDDTFFTRRGLIDTFLECGMHFDLSKHSSFRDYVCLLTREELNVFQQLCRNVRIVFVTRRENEDTRPTLPGFGIPDDVEICVVPRGQTKAEYIENRFGNETKGARIIVLEDSDVERDGYSSHSRLRRAEIVGVRYE
jgi:hypothetical protein